MGRSRPTLTALEDRITPYVLSGYSWAEPNVSVSFMPDGTQMSGSYTSSLFAELNPVAPAATWQSEFARALQTWAQYTPLNFRLAPDDGSPQVNFYEPTQGSTRFGDIRLGARPLSSNVVGLASFPTGGSTASGDISLNAARTYYIGSQPDIYSVLLHESGHALGLDHGAAGTVMYGAYSGTLTGLTADDIAGIRAIYGTRRHDAYDAAAANDSLGAATALALNSGGATFRADLTSQADVDFYRVVASGSSLTVSVDARNLSLLAPKVLVYDTAGNLLGTTGAAYGQAASLSLTGLTAGQSYYLVADGATADVFGMGAYVLNAQFSGGSTLSPPVAPGNLTATAVSGSRVDVAWADNSSNEDGFRVEQSHDGVNFTFAGTAGANATTFAATGLTANTSYYFRVRAYNGGGDSSWSNTAQATTRDVAPAAPGSLTAAAASASQVNLTWQDNSGNETGFRVERSTDGVNFTLAGTAGADVTGYAVTGLTAGTTYYFRVQAVNGAGVSVWSNTAQATTTSIVTVPTLSPDRFESNETAATARYLGKLNNASQAALTVHTATDVDCFAFTVNTNGKFQASITFRHAAGNLDLYVYDAQMRQLAGGVSTSDNESVTVSLTDGQRYYLKVVGPSGGTNSYDLAVAKLSGKTGGSGGGNLIDSTRSDWSDAGSGKVAGVDSKGCDCPMCSGAADGATAGTGAGRDRGRLSQMVDAERQSGGLEFRPVRQSPPVRPADQPGVGESLASQLLAELDRLAGP